jgi:hypothetical protein
MTPETWRQTDDGRWQRRGDDGYWYFSDSGPTLRSPSDPWEGVSTANLGKRSHGSRVHRSRYRTRLRRSSMTDDLMSKKSLLARWDAWYPNHRFKGVVIAIVTIIITFVVLSTIVVAITTSGHTLSKRNTASMQPPAYYGTTPSSTYQVGFKYALEYATTHWTTDSVPRPTEKFDTKVCQTLVYIASEQQRTSSISPATPKWVQGCSAGLWNSSVYMRLEKPAMDIRPWRTH